MKQWDGFLKPAFVIMPANSSISMVLFDTNQLDLAFFLLKIARLPP
jgi:hypothetical protein